jgi:hypothetical protein
VRLVTTIAECVVMLGDHDACAEWIRRGTETERAPIDIMSELGGLEEIACTLVTYLRAKTSPAERSRSSCRPRSTRSRRP